MSKGTVNPGDANINPYCGMYPAPLDIVVVDPPDAFHDTPDVHAKEFEMKTDSNSMTNIFNRNLHNISNS